MNDRHIEEKPACSVKSAPFPADVHCEACGADIEIWSDEADVKCKNCGRLIINKDRDI